MSMGQFSNLPRPEISRPGGMPLPGRFDVVRFELRGSRCLFFFGRFCFCDGGDDGLSFYLEFISRLSNVVVLIVAGELSID